MYLAAVLLASPVATLGSGFHFHSDKMRGSLTAGRQVYPPQADHSLQRSPFLAAKQQAIVGLAAASEDSCKKNVPVTFVYQEEVLS